ncbi:MAG TPA: TolC family protein [Polyangiaceae bacterium]|nr:TolC family protein [Polyangiaceae bacterium]
MLKRSLGLCLFFASQAALAQPAPAPKAAPATKPVTAPPAAPPTAPVATPTPVAPSPAEPTLPQVTDDMLAPVPPATNVLSNWRDALRLLRENSSQLRTLKAQEDVARAQARQALAPALPSLTAQGSVTRQLLKGKREYQTITTDAMGMPNGFESGTVTVPDPATTWQAGLNLRVPLVNFSAWHERGTALDRIEVAKLDTKAAERVNIAAVANAVVTAVTAERLAEVSRVSLESALSNLDLYKRRAALGAASAIDVLRIEQEVSLSRSQVVSANDGVLRTREDLGAALGSPEPYGVVPAINLDQLASDAKTSCQPADVDSRADVRAAQATIAVSKRNEEGVNKTYLPTLDAVSALTYWSPVSVINNEHVTWSVGGVLSWTLYDGGLRYGTKEQRIAETRIATEQLREAKRVARLEVAQAFRAVRTTEATLAVAAKTRELAAETARLTKLSYLNGSGTTFDLVDTARRQREAELDYTIKEFDVLRAKIAALLALAACDV